MRLRYAFPEPLPIERARGIQTVNTIAAMARAGADIELAYVPSSMGDPFAFYGVSSSDRVRLLPLSYRAPFPVSWIHSNRFFAARLRRCWSEREGAPVVMVRHLKLAAWIAARVPAWRLVYEAHEVFSDTAPLVKAGRRAQEEALVMRRSSAVVANSGATAERLIERYGGTKRMRVISNGVTIPAIPSRKDWKRAGRHVVYAGSLFAWKGVEDLVRAGAHLPGLKITIIGGDPYQQERLRRIAATGGAEVEFAGRLRHSEVMSRLAEACIAVLPNRMDPDSQFSSPVKLFEYLGSGCAVVATELPVFREVLSQDDASWARPEDPEDLARAIRALAEDPERAKRLGSRSRARSADFTWDARATRLLDLLAEVEAGR